MHFLTAPEEQPPLARANPNIPAGTLHFVQLVLFDGFTLNPTAVVSPQNPRIDVEIWAWFDYIPGQDEYSGFGEFDLHAAEPNWYDIRAGQIVGPGSGIVLPWPVFAGSSILDVKARNDIYFPPIGVFPVPGNPVLFAVAEWETTHLTPRSVGISTAIEQFTTLYSAIGGEYTFPPEIISNGHVQIKVIPAPAPFLALAWLFSRRDARPAHPRRLT